MRHALVNSEGKVVNVIIWEGHAFKAPENYLIVRSDICDCGDKYDDKKGHFIKATDGKRYHKDCKLEDYLKGDANIPD